ncbi:hypothetical protein DPMN_159489 [Dreissena polymorpha]|uniref:Uncharacterized protein n=1 Tax=Dreissena polymorpha TaxID=45954 RepID=A0A9D4EP87_DREPO|nr:hypothetical protein DPMN_159489 [Dreissena polymorpha]
MAITDSDGELTEIIVEEDYKLSTEAMGYYLELKQHNEKLLHQREISVSVKSEQAENSATVRLIELQTTSFGTPSETT